MATNIVSDNVCFTSKVFKTDEQLDNIITTITNSSMKKIVFFHKLVIFPEI